MPVFLFKTPDDYYAFYVKKHGVTLEEAKRSAGHASADYYATWYESPTDPTHINYEATLEDPKTFTRPWKINTILYKRLEKDLELLDYECVEHVYLKLFKELVGTEENRRSPEDQK